MLRTLTRTLLTSAALTVVSFPALAQTPFLPGSLVIDRIGDPTASVATLTNAAYPVFLDEYSTTVPNTLLQSHTLPVTTTGANFTLTDSGSATSDGQLNISSNGQFLTLTGYNTASGTASVAGTFPNAATGANLRVVGIVNLATGAIDTSNAVVAPAVGAGTPTGYYLATASTGNNIRSAATVDGTSLYTAGTTITSATSPQTGIAYTQAGTVGNSVGVSSTALNTRVVGIANNNLYYSTASGTSHGIFQIPGPNAVAGSTTNNGGLPTAAPAAGVTPVQIASTGTTGSPYDFLFTDANTLYVTDDRTSATGGGLEKFTSTDGFQTLANTTLAYTLTVGTVGLRSIAYDGTNFYGTTTEASGDKVVSFTDPGTGTGTIAVTATTLATAVPGEIFRGVRIVPGTPVVAPEPSSLLATALGIGTLGLLIARRRMRSAA